MRGIAVLLFILVLVPVRAWAIPPPEFIFNFFSQIAQMLTVALVFLTTGVGFGYQFLRHRWAAVQNKKLVGVGFIALSLFAALGISYALEYQQAQSQHEAWRAKELQQRLEASLKAQADLRIEVSELQTKLEDAEAKLALLDIPDSVREKRLKEGRLPSAVSVEKVELSPFFKSHRATSIMISNDDLKAVLRREDKDYMVLDAREDIEWETGRLEGATHIRFADLRAGRWKELPTDKFVYLFCYSSLRGSELAEFLRSVGVMARFVENGVKGWGDAGGQWSGQIELLSKFGKPQHLKKMTKEEFEKFKGEGVRVVDARFPAEYLKSHETDAVNVTVLHQSAPELEKASAQLPPQTTFLVVCNEPWSCFDAYVTGIELEKKGHKYVGRYTEYRP